MEKEDYFEKGGPSQRSGIITPEEFKLHLLNQTYDLPNTQEKPHNRRVEAVSITTYVASVR
jgi:hypothetical protein